MRRQMSRGFLAVMYCSSLLAVVSNPALSQPTTTPQRTPPLLPVETTDRGQLLYENHCQVCHESVVHVRQNRRAESKDQLQTWVVRWSTHLKLTWTAEDTGAVVDYLNQRYYQFDGSVKKQE